MNERRDLVQGWLRMADEDLAALGLALDAQQALGTVAFHAQQAAEKTLKAYLIWRGADFPFTHSLPRLLELCRVHDAAFGSLAREAELLTPYAIRPRYDPLFRPTVEEAREARSAALVIKDFVLQRLPELRP